MHAKTPEIIYIFVDALAKPELQRFLDAAAQSHKLAAVVYDEVYQVLWSSHFRACMWR
jgi:hypothetical protein